MLPKGFNVQIRLRSGYWCAKKKFGWSAMHSDVAVTLSNGFAVVAGVGGTNDARGKASNWKHGIDSADCSMEENSREIGACANPEVRYKNLGRRQG